PLSCLLILYFLMRRPPPISTLFPYTTLFRSNPQDIAVAALPRALCCRGLVALVTGFFVEARIVHPALPHLFTGGEITLGCDFMTDRKSTRLNSSHVSISYAVFCLKKKKKLSN